MLVFIDESGHPHARDAARRPVLAAVCLRQEDAREISRALYSVKRRVLGDGRQHVEMKARKLLDRSTFRRIPEKRELVDG